MYGGGVTLGSWLWNLWRTNVYISGMIYLLSEQQIGSPISFSSVVVNRCSILGFSTRVEFKFCEKNKSFILLFDMDMNPGFDLMLSK